jgi:hypothetical protein
MAKFTNLTIDEHYDIIDGETEFRGKPVEIAG